jgi:predicted phage tail protein
MNDRGSASIAGATYDPTTRRLYVTERFGAEPRVHVYEVSSGTALSLPPAPGSLAGKVLGSQVALSWTPPAGTGWAGYLLEAGTAPGLSNILRLPVAAGTTTFSSDAPPGQFFVRLRSASLTGLLSPPSNEVAINVGGRLQPPGSPRNLKVRAAGDAVVLSWAPPAAGDPVADYVIDAGTSPSTPNIAYDTSVGSGLVALVNGVPPGRYYVRLRARNLAGSGAPSNVTSVLVGAPATIPPSPTNLSAQVGADRSLRLSWDLPDEGSAATGFVLEAGFAEGRSDIGVVALGPAQGLRLAGVPPGTYFVRVRAYNPAGRSVPTRDLRIVI